MHRFLTALSSLVLAFALGGCANVIPSGLNVLVAIPNAFTYAQVGTAPITLQATTTYDGTHKGVKWELTTAGVGCAPACGTLAASKSPSFSALYTPPATLPVNQQATITAYSVAEGTQDYAFTFSIIPPVSVQITNKFTNILDASAPVQVNATVANDPTNAGVTWTLTAGGSNCSPACGTIAASAAPSFSAQYTPPPTLPTGANLNPTITATSVTNTSASDSFSFTILSSAALVQGSYAFVLRGYDGNQLPMSLAGTITADGNGNITNAEFDVNDYGGVTQIPSPQTGTYTVQLSPTGLTQVLFEISSFTFPGSTQDMKFRCFLSKDGTHGRIIEFDGSGYINAGTIWQQNSSNISAQPVGSFAFGVNSDAPFGGRTIAAGQLILSTGSVTGGLIDQSVDAGNAPTFIGQPISPGAVTGPDSLGRGTLVITVQNQSVEYAYYVIDANHFLMIETDRGLVFGTVFAGDAQMQSGLTANSVNGVNVIQLTGFDEPTGTSNVEPVVLIGLLTVTGGNSFSLLFDINDLGTVLTRHPAGGSVTFDPSTGRAAISAPDGFNSNFLSQAAWYLYGQGQGYFVEEDISTNGLPPAQSITNRALSGTTLPQTGTPFTATSIPGNSIVGVGASSSPLIPNAELAANFGPPANGKATGLGNFSAVGDLTTIPSDGGNLPDIQFNSQYELIDATTGYGEINFPAQFFGQFGYPGGTMLPATFYMVGPNQFVCIGVNTQTLTDSGIIFVDPD